VVRCASGMQVSAHCFSLWHAAGSDAAGSDLAACRFPCTDARWAAAYEREWYWPICAADLRPLRMAAVGCSFRMGRACPSLPNTHARRPPCTSAAAALHCRRSAQAWRHTSCLSKCARRGYTRLQSSPLPSSTQAAWM
jgi:hypothetical protein